MTTIADDKIFQSEWFKQIITFIETKGSNIGVTNKIAGGICNYVSMGHPYAPKQCDISGGLFGDIFDENRKNSLLVGPIISTVNMSNMNTLIGTLIISKCKTDWSEDDKDKDKAKRGQKIKTFNASKIDAREISLETCYWGTGDPIKGMPTMRGNYVPKKFKGNGKVCASLFYRRYREDAEVHGIKSSTIKWETIRLPEDHTEDANNEVRVADKVVATAQVWSEKHIIPASTIRYWSDLIDEVLRQCTEAKMKFAKTKTTGTVSQDTSLATILNSIFGTARSMRGFKARLKGSKKQKTYGSGKTPQIKGGMTRIMTHAKNSGGNAETNAPKLLRGIYRTIKGRPRRIRSNKFSVTSIPQQVTPTYLQPLDQDTIRGLQGRMKQLINKLDPAYRDAVSTALREGEATQYRGIEADVWEKIEQIVSDSHQKCIGLQLSKPVYPLDWSFWALLDLDAYSRFDDPVKGVIAFNKLKQSTMRGQYWTNTARYAPGTQLSAEEARNYFQIGLSSQTVFYCLGLPWEMENEAFINVNGGVGGDMYFSDLPDGIMGKLVPCPTVRVPIRLPKLKEKQVDPQGSVENYGACGLGIEGEVDNLVGEIDVEETGLPEAKSLDEAVQMIKQRAGIAGPSVYYNYQTGGTETGGPKYAINRLAKGNRIFLQSKPGGAKMFSIKDAFVTRATLRKIKLFIDGRIKFTDLTVEDQGILDTIYCRLHDPARPFTQSESETLLVANILPNCYRPITFSEAVREYTKCRSDYNLTAEELAMPSSNMRFVKIERTVKIPSPGVATRASKRKGDKLDEDDQEPEPQKMDFETSGDAGAQGAPQE